MTNLIILNAKMVQKVFEGDHFIGLLWDLKKIYKEW